MLTIEESEFKASGRFMYYFCNFSLPEIILTMCNTHKHFITEMFYDNYQALFSIHNIYNIEIIVLC